MSAETSEAAELFERTRNTGQFVKRAYIIKSEPVNPSIFDDVVDEHRDYLEELAAKGKLLAAGPFIPGGSERKESGVGMIVVYADSEDEARRIGEEDPMHRKGVRKFTIDFWLVKHVSHSHKEIL
ncbi:hypothetical protein OIDMADRAFT_17938 [Oidiodendron maius Zn]|uniref:YCII-related domain-containing protein n=1 Tax=Oidiodendron maius (strain Zn) TaxID=913774 RepID=A0A0C3HMM3_OIDMZ|nr:hypothetical protein OIDMADRAFT_17938 [Oidiodendron maius Zn]